MNDFDLQKLLEKAAEQGAERALSKVGLSDVDAGNDIRDLRRLMKDWRDVKRTFIRSIVGDLAKLILGALALGAYLKFWGHQ